METTTARSGNVEFSWEARGYLGKAIYESNILPARGVVYSAHDPSDKADMWRAALKANFIDLIDNVLYMIQNEHASLVFNLMNHSTISLHDDGSHDTPSSRRAAVRIKQAKKHKKGITGICQNVR